MAALKVGNGLTDGVAVGPLVNKSTPRQGRSSLVEDAVGQGRQGPDRRQARPRARATSTRPPCSTNVCPDGASMLREEIFRPGRGDPDLHGPRTPCSSSANDSEYGLASYLYTERRRPRHARWRASWNSAWSA